VTPINLQGGTMQSAQLDSVKSKVLQEIYQSRKVIDQEGNSHALHSEITPDEGRLIIDMIQQHKAGRVLEIGCAYGISSMFIQEALSELSDTSHIIIDPGQQSEWKNIGVHNLAKSGHRNYTLIEEPSELALPKLLEQGERFQAALIDGFHTFEHVMLDFFYVQRLLDVGGIVMLDDLQLPGIRKVARYISTLPHFKIVGVAKQSIYPPSMKRRVFEMPLRTLSKLLPRDYSQNLFDQSFVRSDYDCGLISEMLAFEKTGTDNRGSHWHSPF